MVTRKTILAVMLAVAACTGSTGSHTDGGPAARIERADDPVPYQYLVVLKPGPEPVPQVATDLLVTGDAWLLRSYERALRGFAMHASEETALAIATDPRVAWVAEDGRVRAQAIAWQEGAPEALDRIDQRAGTDGKYGFHDAAGERIHAYVLDTGVLASHTEFLGRPPDQVDFVRDGQGGDCNGHGTHVAAILGGATWGVAKQVRLHSLRVLGCDGAGATSDLVAALDWLVTNAQTPAVVNLSLGRGPDAALDAAVAAVVARGIPVVVAAGDAGRDACTTSPARVPEAVTVASTDRSGAEAAAFSNRGPCVDFFAPGVEVRSASIVKAAGSLTYGESVVQSGTSVSAPFVAGAVALYLGRYTGATPEAVSRALVANSTRAPATLPRYTPDRFLFTTFVDDDNSADAEPPTATIDTPLAGAIVSGSEVEVTATAGDDVGVTRVELFASGRFIASSEGPNHAFTWDTRREPNGSATLVVRAYDRAGNDTDSVPVAVTVANDGIAHLDPSLGVPRCETVASICDSVDLLTGRADLGPEENAPNTLQEACPTASSPSAVCACADGPFGKYGLDESIEQITVTTLDGGELAAGADVEVAVRVYVGSTFHDELDLYSSPAVVEPTWRYVGSVKPQASGLQTLTARFTLPEGGVQAVRAALRHGGFASTCTEGGFDERDDLAFVAAAGVPDSAAPADVAITSPRPDAQVSGPITVTATATDDHLVSRVEFTVGTILIGSDSGAPYSVDWNSGLVPNGTYDLRATAYDGAGNVTVSAPVAIQVKDETRPTVSITSPPTETQVTRTPITVRTAATDNGVVRQVELWVTVIEDGVPLETSLYATDTTDPYEFEWSREHGTYRLMARAFDGAGLSTDSAPVIVRVGDTNPPTCSLRVPAEVDPAHVVGPVLLEAEAVDDTEVASVRFYRVGVPDQEVATSITAPHAGLWNSGPLENGAYDLYCLATDTSGQISPDRRLLRLTVDDQTAPTVELVAPAVTYDPPGDPTGTIVPTPVAGAIVIGARAGDDGAIERVEFYLDDSTEPFEVRFAEPYEFTWDSGTVANGPHTLTAEAHDYNGHSTLSSALQITTGNTTPPSVEILLPLTGATLTGLVPVRAQVSQPGGEIVKVELLDGDALVQTPTAAPTALPYELAWTTEGATLGPHTLTVRATDLLGNVGTASVEVFVEATSAAYDAVYGAPECKAEGPRCQTSLLLDGRGALGPEPNGSNNRIFPCPTAADPGAVCQCLDGDAGVYHEDESIDFISISSRDGGDLVGGGLVDVEVRAWIFDRAQDRIDLFYAADATDPVWVPLQSVAPAGVGLQTVRTSYALPHGRRQAFRASVRFGALETGACVPGDYNDHDDVVFAVAAAPDASPPAVAVTDPAAGASVEGLVTIAATATDDVAIGSVTFLVDGVEVGTDYAAPYSWTWDTGGLAAGDRTLSAVATDLAGNVTASAPVLVTVVDRVLPTVTLTAPLGNETVQGTVTLAAVADDAVGVTKVEFRVGGTLVATDSAAPYSAAWNSASKADGVYTVTATAVDAAGNSAPSAPVSILVSNFGNARWDNGVKAPACSKPASKCFTGTLVDGRGPLGPEPNTPNTLGATCADGTQGTYHVDESIDAVTVRSATGTLTTGGTAIVEVKIWAGQAYLMDALDLYFTEDASAAAPVWTPIATLRPAHAGAQVLSASYRLPAGGALQAVRAQLRYAGAATLVCGDGTFDDRDDVVFAVNP